eukprot:961729-Rhodomonas_salina.1
MACSSPVVAPTASTSMRPTPSGPRWKPGSSSATCSHRGTSHIGNDPPCKSQLFLLSDWPAARVSRSALLRCVA